MQAALAKYSDWLRERGISENTIGQRVGLMTRLDRDLGGLLQASDAALMAWLTQFNGWTRLTYFNHVTSWLDWAVEVGLRDRNGLRDKSVKRPATPRLRPKPLTQTDVVRILACARGDLRAWLMLGLYAGLRVHEMAKLRGEDVHDNFIRVVGKGGQLEMVPTHPVLWDLAQLYPRTGVWFPSRYKHLEHTSVNHIENKVRDLFRPLGIEGNIHRTRATYGTELLRNGTNIKLVQELMRHRNLSSTDHYLGVGDDELRAAIGTLGSAA